jgi:hypothetical protein
VEVCACEEKASVSEATNRPQQSTSLFISVPFDFPENSEAPSNQLMMPLLLREAKPTSIHASDR